MCQAPSRSRSVFPWPIPVDLVRSTTGMSALSWDQLAITSSTASLLPFPTSLHFQLYNPLLINVCWKNHLSELPPMLSLSVWPIKKLGSTLTAFLSSSCPCLWQMHVIFLVLRLTSSLWIRTIFLYSTPHTGARPRLLHTTTIRTNIRVARTRSALAFVALGRRSFLMSFWKVILHLNDLIFRVFFPEILKWNFSLQVHSLYHLAPWLSWHHC